VHIRRSSDEIKPQLGVAFNQRERENSTLGVLDPYDLFGKRRALYESQIWSWRSCREDIQEAFREFNCQEKWGVLRCKPSKPETSKSRRIYIVDLGKIFQLLDRVEEKRVILGVWMSGEVGCDDAQNPKTQNCKILKS
jgi:hypothetical protein